MDRTGSDVFLRTQLVRPFLAAVRARGGDADALVREFGLGADAEMAPDVFVSISQLRAFLVAAERAVGDPLLGVHTAPLFPRGAWGLVEFATRNAPRVRDAFARLARYGRLLDDVVRFTYVEEGQEGRLSQEVPGLPGGLGRHANEFWMAALLGETARAIGRPLRPVRVWLAHPAPREPGLLAGLAEALGTSALSFGAEANAFALSAADLDAPLLSADPALLQHLDAHAEQALRHVPVPGGLALHVRQRLRQHLGQRLPGVAEVARALRMSPRTLQRRLADEGTSFQALVDAVREEQARLYVKESERALDEVAWLLGYSEKSTFLRAFRRWTGTTPGQYRQG
ncbi:MULTISPECIES: AraC family transcriptional regulator [Myxococcaceae]|uniref:AraC family transcriptional regulator n=1 Tax=Myxococcaceae TaxID=31 RepID=UPI00188FAC73|nr:MULTISPECIES: AraC family transcriptional regulator [Myxococcaceae]MBF5041572.1 AraC family transcriptional regulator [Simulacricoccus sp. 17bor-14]